MALNTIDLTLFAEQTLENTEGTIKKRKIQKLTIYGTQDEKKTKQYVLDTTIRKETQIYIFHSNERTTYMDRSQKNIHMDSTEASSSMNDHN